MFIFLWKLFHFFASKAYLCSQYKIVILIRFFQRIWQKRKFQQLLRQQLRSLQLKKATVEVVINAESIGFKAGDVYQALASTEKGLNVKEIASIAKISIEETYLGLGWLFKEGKIIGDGKLVSLA